jgi:acetyl-CoA carboxylase biotin carboxyl carrier protein
LTCEINRSVAGIERCCDKETIGVLQLGGYSDPGFALGDAGNKYSYGCNVIYQEVRGLSFRLCQMGYDDPAIGNLKKAFNLIDNNGNGKLNREEIRAFLHRTQQKDEATDDQLDQLIKDNDLSEIELEHSTEGSESIYVRVSRQKNNETQIISKASPILPTVRTEYEDNGNIQEMTTTTNLENNPGTLFSPMVGTVYLAPEPEASPFVQIGDKVTAGQTILIVEAMKTLNQIPAINGGVVKRILVEDGTPVEYGSPLVIIE